MNPTTRTSLLLAALCLTGCPGEEQTIPEDIFGELGEVAPYASAEQRETFERGREVALRRFTVGEGLGPHFNLSFCGGCHERPLLGGSAPRYRNFLLVATNQPGFPQAHLGVNGVQTQFNVETTRQPTPERTNVTAERNAIPFFGAGLMAEIPGESILANADPEDEDGDGISGRPNYDETFVGRFGRKSQTVSVEGFIRGPLFNHLGVTSDPLSQELKARLPVPSNSVEVEGTREGLSEDVGAVIQAQAAAPDEPITDEDGVADPELAEQDLFDLVSFSMLLAAPRPDDPTPDSEAGALLFEEMGCQSCHVHTLASPRGLIPLYSDLLLHDMGEELADGIEQGQATGSEFRTQPLWGIAAVAPYLHDGRADTLDEAIRWHGGEAQAAKEAYEAASDTERGLVITFLESLGGRSQRSEGLIPPDEPPPAANTEGGPMAGIDLERFEAGRRVFDRDFGFGAGLGRPTFNGDSCRACHFEPAVGGAGPVGLNVTRQAIDPGTGEPAAPAGGTMAHRLASARGVRPEIDPMSNVFELRQAPSIFGLGLIDRVPEAVIMANADPDDMDMDGISGRAHVLGDGRLGRLGWKANVPSLAEFARDGMTNELGITVPEQAGLSFGSGTDSDQAPDPEIPATDLEALVFYMSSLAPPPRHRTDTALEDMGEELFETIGCGSCHRALELEDGTPLFLYSDLLLHDVFEPDHAGGIPDGMATPREMRTAPLWGISSTAPYMHDGLAGTLEQAIARHFSEAEASASAFSALTDAEREAVLAFLESL